jgi:type IV pilus assembly protein PilM
MRFWPRKHVATFGLDIGSSAIKVVELAKVRRGHALRAHASVPVEPDAIGDGSIRNPAAVTDAIAECVAKAGITATRAALSVSGRDSIVKRVALPKVPSAELADAILIEAAHHIPFAIDEVFMDYQLVAETATGISVLLVATKKVKVLEYVAAVEAAGLDVAVVDLDAFAVQNQFELSHSMESAESVALIDIGAAVMKTNVVRGGAPLFARDVPFGGNNYTEAVARQLGIALEVAESIKCGWDGNRSDIDLAPLLATVSHELSLEVQRTFDYVASTSDSERIGKVVLSGGGARLRGIADFLASSWRVPVELAQPFQPIARQWSTPPDSELLDGGLIFAVAVGLALRNPGDVSR